MRIVFIAQVAAVAFLVSGCPGAPASDPSGGGTCLPGANCESTSSTGGDGGNSNGGAGGTNAGGAGGSGGSNAGGSGGAGAGGNGAGGGQNVDCEPLALELEQLQIPAQECNSEGPSGAQCKQSIDGLCCPIAVTDAMSPEVLAYLEALMKYQQMGCMAMCPPDPCPVVANAKCMPGSMGDTCGG